MLVTMLNGSSEKTNNPIYFSCLTTILFFLQTMKHFHFKSANRAHFSQSTHGFLIWTSPIFLPVVLLTLCCTLAFRSPCNHLQGGTFPFLPLTIYRTFSTFSRIYAQLFLLALSLFSMAMGHNKSVSQTSTHRTHKGAVRR